MQPEQLSAMLIPFYLGEQPDIVGRMIQEIWAWDVEDLEDSHDYIQWLFPLSERSAFNSDAPIADETIIQAFRSQPQLRQNLQRSLTVLLHFYGLQRSKQQSGAVEICPSADFAMRRSKWLSPLNHNYLRLTRILKCLMMFGLEDEAQALYQCLRQIYQENRDAIGGQTLRYWTSAIISSAT